ncbi:MAG: hypothetical protein M3162_05735 [Thermoproteota archaeon]|nr:hypothetical protein [Thermoproteota archaeon]
MSFPGATTNINPKDCIYGCNTKIYWNASNSEYLEVITKKKHICPNRSRNNNNRLSGAPGNSNASARPTYHNNSQTGNMDSSNSSNYNHNSKKIWLSKPNNKQPMDNSLQILQGPTETIRKQYEVLSDLIKEFKGKTHGSQSHILSDNSLQIIVYYEVPEGMREEIKRMFEIYARNEIKPHGQ